MGLFDKILGKKQDEKRQATENAGMLDNGEIEVFDEYGRKMLISKDEWIKKVLPDQIKRHWNDANTLYNDILFSLNDGFHNQVLDAAIHLKQIDNIKERGYVILAIVYMKNNLVDEAEKILYEYIELYGKTGTILTNLAKVYYEKGDESKGLDVLWEGLCIDPNQENGLPWWAAIHNDKHGKEGYLNALEKASEIKGSYLPQIYLARHYLENKELGKAKNLYTYILNIAKEEPQTLYVISGDLGNNGYIKELIEMIVPIYDIDKHDLRTGLNLLQAYLHTQNYVEGQKLLNRIMQIHRPDLKDYLMSISNEFEKIREAGEKIEVPKDEVKYELVAIDKPIWYYGLKSPDWLLPQKIRSKRIGLFVLSNTTIQEMGEPAANREDDLGRLTRSIPLLMQEAFLFFSNLEPITLIPAALGIGPVVSGKEWERDSLYGIACDQNLDYIISGSICLQNSKYGTKFIILDKDNNADSVIENEFSEKSFGAELISIMKEALNRITGNNEGGNLNDLMDYYMLPNQEHTEQYLKALGQSLMQTFVDNQIVTYESIWGERNILNWYLQLCFSMPGNPIPKILFLSGISKSKSYGSEIYKEFKNQVIKIFTDEQANSILLKSFLPFIYRLFDMQDEFDTYCRANNPNSDKYIEWLKGF